MELLVLNEEGMAIDATIEVSENSIVLQSRGGTKGTEKAKNTDYSIALRLLLARLQRNKDLFVEGFVDSSRVQTMAKENRRVLSQQDLSRTLQELFTLISRRMQAVGKLPSTERHTGNANKRIRFIFSNVAATKLEEIANGSAQNNYLVEGNEPSPVELYWAEGRPELVLHLKRERANGLSQAKKTAFLREHGKLFCEMCLFDPVAAYKDEAAKACIEVHHRAVAISEMASGHKTKLNDLQCLCANCHRLVHANLKVAVGKTASERTETNNITDFQNF
jgi:predicted HNH restriction endonuclease